MSTTKIRVASRKSLLALTQTQQTIDFLSKANPGVEFEIFPVTSTGDRVTDRPLSQMGGQGVFVKELENALQANEADIAVHSLKDVPSIQPDDLVLACFPKRANPQDILLCPGDITIDTLKQGAKIGTSSPRRLVQLQAFRKDFTFADLRGNLDTRIRKLNEGQYDAIVVAAAGMGRLSFTYNPMQLLSTTVCLPAIGQGALTIECRKNDATAIKVVSAINDPETEMNVLAERAFMREVGAGCSAPIAAFAVTKNGTLMLEALIGDIKTIRLMRDKIETPAAKAVAAGVELAQKLLAGCKKEGISLQR